MPIYNKPPTSALSGSATIAEVNDHASEAAKMKRTRSQAYFNSYDFDAIEVLSDDDDDEAEENVVGTSRNQRRQQPALSHSNSTRLPPTSQRDQTNHATHLPSHVTANQNRRHHPFGGLTLNDATNNMLASQRSVSSTSSSSTSTEDQHRKYNRYFQRLGAFFAQGQRVGKPLVHVKPPTVPPPPPPPPPQQPSALLPTTDFSSGSLTNSTQSIPDIIVHTNAGGDEQLVEDSHVSTGERISVAAVVEKVESGNFLLPRAMLKYQSTNGVVVQAGGNSSNSMPLAGNTNVTHEGAMKSSLQNAYSQNTNNNTSNITKNPSPIKPTLATHPTTTTAAPTMTTAKTRKIHPNNSEKGTGSSALASHKKYAAPAPPQQQPRSGEHKNQQQQQPNLNNSSAQLTPLKHGQSSQLAKMAKTPNESMAALETTTTTAALTATSKTGPTATITTMTTNNCTSTITNSLSNSSSIANISSSNESSSSGNHVAGKPPRERISSHQSHYSTDKSGSSGYYSSNVASTYSIEDHIYCEPVIDVLDLNSKISKSKLSSSNKKSPAAATITASSTLAAHGSMAQRENKSSRLKNMGQSERLSDSLHDDGVDVGGDDDDDDDGGQLNTTMPPPQAPLLTSLKLNSLLSPELAPPQLSENLRILESSIENLDRHLKTYSSLSSQEHITAFVQAHQNGFMPPLIGDEAKSRSYQHLPTIMESFDSTANFEGAKKKLPPPPAPHTWQEGGNDQVDDSLMDIDLDSFLLVNERNEKHQLSVKRRGKLDENSGIVNPSFQPNDDDDIIAVEEETKKKKIHDALEENNYKCAKYINSCPEDAYRVESDIAASSASQKSTSMEHFLKRYEDQIHFQNTRELLEDVRDKIRLLSRASSESDSVDGAGSTHKVPPLPQELNNMIKTLKLELETYLARMNQHSELEIRQLCSGLVKNQHIVKMKKAFERRRSIASLSALDSEYDFSAYEALRDGVMVSASGVPYGIRQQITSVRCASDPNFKMKRKSLTEIFPAVDFHVESTANRPGAVGMANETRVTNANYQNVNFENGIIELSPANTLTKVMVKTQLQRNLSFHQPILNQLNAKTGGTGGSVARDDIGKVSGSSSSNGEAAGDKDSIMEWHRKKPSAWELYYGTNRMNQTLLGKRGLIVHNANQATMSYPSSRPESDFTLDLPRAEQLRIKMEKEKKFRQRCRYITSFLSLVFFLLTVMVVSLVLTRGKRMFGSMI